MNVRGAETSVVRAPACCRAPSPENPPGGRGPSWAGGFAAVAELAPALGASLRHAAWRASATFLLGSFTVRKHLDFLSLPDPHPVMWPRLSPGQGRADPKKADRSAVAGAECMREWRRREGRAGWVGGRFWCGGERRVGVAIEKNVFHGCVRVPLRVASLVAPCA